MLTATTRFPIILSLSGALHLAAFSIQMPSGAERASISSPVRLQVQITQPAMVGPTLATAPALAAPTSQTDAFNTASTSKAKASSLPANSELRRPRAQPIFSSRASMVAATDNESAHLPPAAEIVRPDAPPPVALNAPGADVGTNDEVQGGPATVSPSATTAARAAPSLAFSTPPRYPEEARWEKRTGKAKLAFRLRADGTPIAVKLLGSSGHEDLDAAAIEALYGWRFKVSRDVDSNTWHQYAIRFELL